MNINARPLPKQSKFLILFASVWLIVGLPFMLFGISFLQKEARFAAESSITTGRITNKYIDTSTDSEGRRSNHYIAEYEFSNPQGDSLSGKSNLDSERWNTVSVNDSIEIQYIGSDASEHRINHTSDTIVGWIFTGIGGLCVLIGAVSLYFDLSKRLKLRRLATSGIVTTGKIVSVAPGNLSINGVPQWVVKYAFQDYQGKPHTGSTGYLSPEDAQYWKQGESGRVKFDQNDPSVNMWLGDAIQ